MTASLPILERRRRRAASGPEAMGLYLESLAAAHDLGALLLSDETGWLVGSVRGDFDAPRVASVGRWCVEGMGDPQDELVATGGEDLYAHAIDVADRTLYLTSVRGRVPRVRDVESAARRMLGAAATLNPRS